MGWLFLWALLGSMLWLPWKVYMSFKRGRDGRSSRMWICCKLWFVFISSLFSAISLFAGVSWITVESIVVATVIFAIMLCYYWCVIDAWCKVAYLMEGGRKEELYEYFIESGGDPFCDFIPPPINNDPFLLRALGKTELER